MTLRMENLGGKDDVEPTRDFHLHAQGEAGVDEALSLEQWPPATPTHQHAAPSKSQAVVKEARNSLFGLRASSAKESKNYSDPKVLEGTFELLANLHQLLPNRLLEQFHTFRTEQEKCKCT